MAAILLLGTQLLLVWLYISDRGPGSEPGYRFPLPERVVAMVELLESGADAERILGALNGPDLLVLLSDAPVADEAVAETTLPRVERVLARYDDVLGGRPYAAYIAVPDGVAGTELQRRDRTLWSRYPLRMAIGLSDGRTLVVETRDDLLTQIYSVPIGFWSGIFGLVSALIVLLVLRRETAPLRALARAAEAFSAGAAPTPVRERGAPELRHLIAAFNRMQVRIADLLEGRRVMLGALGHDLRTYLTRFQLKADAAGAESLTPDIAHMASILENCLALARDPDGKARLATVDLVALVARVAADLAETGQEIAVALPEAELTVRANDLALERALRNVVDNAVRYGANPSISAQRQADMVELVVADSGPGIPAEDRARLMQPFLRGNAARTADGAGSGLGLSIAKALIEQHGGTLSLAANQPRGLRVSLCLPAATAPDPPGG
ncbi:MAG: ATP-binding protein [Pseudomonadota bacterium]